MKLFAFRHKGDKTLAELYHLVDEAYLVECGCNGSPFVGMSLDEMNDIIHDCHNYVINDIDMDDYEIVEFELNCKFKANIA
ncbi:hypothetical protein UGMREWDR_CDS0059 [Aeromonas phage GomatiRiver_11]|nr:hypothetical protein OBDJBBDK_00054 [Aeromonas phage AhFM11]WKW84226.1 hypothetical protein UGMREWDR_CDS0059 [Aeromonas phage GomatiRiver_11]